MTSFINHIKTEKMPSEVLYHFPFLKWGNDFKFYKNVWSVMENMILRGFSSPSNYFQMDYIWSQILLVKGNRYVTIKKNWMQIRFCKFKTKADNMNERKYNKGNYSSCNFLKHKIC